MAVERTDEWLKEYNYEPKVICRELEDFFVKTDRENIYHYLQQHGMYNSRMQGKHDVKLLIEEDVWTKVDQLYRKYRETWDGPDIPLFIFPYKKQSSLFMRSHTKSGLAFPDKLFLFVSPKLSEHQLEALFIHEYHHVCRMSKQRKRVEDYTVADAIILEGLAEYTVQTIKGEKYLAPWTKQYSLSFLDSYWKTKFSALLDVKKQEKKHDYIIYGRGSYPFMIGYSIGFYLVEQYAKVEGLSVKKSFFIYSDIIINHFSKNQ